MGTIITILQLLAALTLLVIVHEFGHFCFARLFKIRVEKFRMFFDPWFTLFKFKPKNSDTEYGLGWLPLGGYVKIAGMIDESLDTDQMAKPAQPWEFRSHPAWQRLLVMVGGVLFNLITAFVIYIGLTYTYGDSYIPLEKVTGGMQFSDVAKKAGFEDGDMLLRADTTRLATFDEECARLVMNADRVTVLRGGREVTIAMPGDFMQQMLKEQKGFASYRLPFVVDSVLPGGAGAKAHLQRNDVVLGVNGRTMCHTDVMITLANNPGTELTLQVLRGKDTLSQKITPNEQGKIAVMLKRVGDIYPVAHKEYGFWQSIPLGIERTFAQLTSYTGDLKYVFTKEGMSSLGGFGTMGSLFPGVFIPEIFWNICAFLAVILTVMNLLPIPGLDGGHILFVLYEMVTRRKPSQQFLVRTQMVGMLLLMFLMIFANVNDVFRFLLN